MARITAKDRLAAYQRSTNPQFTAAMGGMLKRKFANGGETDNGGRRRRSGVPSKATPSAVAEYNPNEPFLPPNMARPSYTPEMGQDAPASLTPTMATNPVDEEVYNWTRDYIDSPKYKERLANFYKYPAVVQRKRGEKASNVGFTETEEGGSAYSDTSAYPNQLNIAKKQLRNLKAERGEVAAHELGHLTNAGEGSGLKLNPLEQSFIFNKVKTLTPQQKAEYTKSAKEYKGGDLVEYLSEGESHDIAPSENMSDIQALRFYMNKQKIYDARVQDLTPEMLKKAKADPKIKKLFTTKRLFDTFEDKDLIEIMNKVAKNESTLNTPEAMAALGGTIGKNMKKKYAAGGVAGGGWNAAAQALPAVGSLIESLINKPSVQSTQPIMNAQAIHNMANPYDNPGLKFAFGGEMEDVDDDQYFDWLEQMFDNTAEAEEDNEFINTEDETIEMGQDNDEGDDFAEMGEEDGEYGYFKTGGTAKKSKIYIKPSKRGTFTAAAKKHGKSVQGFASQVLANKSKYSPAMVKKANFARNASKWKHAYGGWAGMLKAYANGGQAMGNTPIEVEGEEIVELPNGQMQQMTGPAHEDGGIPMNVPEGTKIYSDRLKIEGQSMQQRKASRERQIARLEKILAKNPTDALTKNTVKATKQKLDMEDAQDMELQNAANEIYTGQKQQKAMGGSANKYQTGGTEGGPIDEYFQNLMGYGDIQVPYSPGQQPFSADQAQPTVPFRQGYMNLGDTALPSTATPPITQPSTALQGTVPTLQTRNIPTASGAEEEYGSATGLTTGDYIGLGANVFGAIAPILNTRNAAAARRPNLNRYIGVGREAIEANDLAQGLVGGAKANALRDLSTSSGSAMARNRMGARGINTMRALDTATQIGRDRAAAQIEQTGNEQLVGLLGQRGQLTNWRDQMQATGATERDVREAQDIDNYYTNMAENLTNFATQAGNIGRNLNISKGNKDNTALLESMSEYFDFGRDKSGKLVLKNKKAK